MDTNRLAPPNTTEGYTHEECSHVTIVPLTEEDAITLANSQDERFLHAISTHRVVAISWDCVQHPIGIEIDGLPVASVEDGYLLDPRGLIIGMYLDITEDNAQKINENHTYLVCITTREEGERLQRERIANIRNLPNTTRVHAPKGEFPSRSGRR